jgi:hypothetical protein
MQSLSNELRGVIEARLRSAGPREILAIASALCTDEPRPMDGASISPAESSARFWIDGDTVQDRTTGLMWTRKNVGSKRFTWPNAKAACAAAREAGYDDWRLPTIRELLSLVDYSRTEPAIDPAFECESAWYWSATPYSSSPSDYAWGVGFGDGHSLCNAQHDDYYVRAVRSGHKD